MRYAQILQKLYSQPLLLEPSAWRAFDHALRDLMNGGKVTLPRIEMPPEMPEDPASDDQDSPCKNGNTNEAEGNCVLSFPALDTALIKVCGVIDKHISMMEMLCYGGCDLDDVDAAIEQVRKDDMIKNVLFVFDSPGGTVIGVPETAEKVYALARQKNVKSFSDSICCSAAYYIASQAGEVFFTESTYGGSIGVIMPPIMDISKMLAEQGVASTQIKSGKFKDTGSMLRPVTEQEIEMLQERSDLIMRMFTGTVTRTRPMITDATMQGQVFFGSQNRDANLCDELVPDLAAALAQF